MTGSLVFVTGASGFIGSEIVYELLQAGYRVRLSVRREDQIAAIQARYPDRVSQLEFVVIPDLGDAAAIRPALDDVEYVLHLASPMPVPGAETVDLQSGFIDPAVQGVVAVLDAVAAAPAVRRLVITSSILSLMPMNAASIVGPQAVDEGVNRRLAVDLDLDKADSAFDKYHVSKLLAHRATLDWVENRAAAGALAFDVATVHPTYVLGHNRARASATPEGSNGGFWLSLFVAQPEMLPWFVDVRDVVAIHLRVLTATTLKPHGQVTELIADGKPALTWETIAAMVKSKYPALPIKLSPPFAASLSLADTSRAERDLGIQWHDIVESVTSSIDQQLVLEAADK